MVAFHNKPELKQFYLDRIKNHREADELVQGATGQGGKGCGIWCTLNTYSHEAYETELGIPQSLARIEDGIFEGLDTVTAMGWPERFLAAIKPGSDLSLVSSRFLHWLLIDPTDGVIKFASSEKSHTAIQRVADLYARRLAGNEPTIQDWQKAAAEAAVWAAEAAEAAAEAAVWAAWAAAWAAAAEAARARAAEAAVWAAEAAEAAAEAAVWAAGIARSKTRARQADKLIELLEAA